MRRRPSKNLPSYKKAIREAQAQGLRFADFKPIWSSWDEPYCEPKVARVLWDQTKYKEKLGIEGNGPLAPGHVSAPRPKNQLDRIKAAVRDNISFRDFWDAARDWPERSYREQAKVKSLFRYYKYRLVAQTTEAIEAPHASYGSVRRFAAVAAIAKGTKFAEFWTSEGSNWNVPMFRLRNWYRGLQKQWRDLIAVYPEAATDELVPALTARAAVHETRWQGERWSK